MDLDQFTRVGIAGYGRNAVVYQVKASPGGTLLALKEFSRHDDAVSMQNESTIYSIIQSSVQEGQRATRAAFLHVIQEDKNAPHPYLLFPLVGPSLTEILAIPGVWPFRSEDVLSIMAQIGHAVEFLHELAIIHTDLKPDNIAFRSGDTYDVEVGNVEHTAKRLKSSAVYLIDFSDAVATKGFGYEMVGSARYRAPEVTMGLRWTAAVDWFSVGCIAAELNIGRPLFPFTTTPERRLAALQKVLGNFPSSMIRRTGQRFQAFLRQNADDSYSVHFPRITVRDAVEHRAILDLKELKCIIGDVQIREICERFLTIDPMQRSTSYPEL